MGAFECTGICHTTEYVKVHNDYDSWHKSATFHENRKSLNSSTAYDAADYSNDLVVDYKFENNLKDDHMWNQHGIWVNGSGSYVAGKVGNAIQVSNNPVEVGAEVRVWDSTNEGYSGNSSKLTEMKYNMTLESWVYPTSDPSDNKNRKIIAKHNYWSGGYTLELKVKNGQYRVGLMTNMGYGGPTDSWEYGQYNCNGLRGAYSTGTIPVNEWTHVAATFDWQGPVGDSNDLSIGKIRIYVNGEDVTTSDYPEYTCWAQPQDPSDADRYDVAFMTSMGENPRCGWCGTALSVGGLNWSSPDSNFIGRIDQVKVWNITKDVSYFGGAIPPDITKVEGQSGYDRLFVTFTEGAYSNPDGTGNLIPSDFTLTDSDNSRTIDSVIHTAGSSTAELLLSSALDASNDLGVDTLAAANNSIYDSYGSVPVGTSSVTISALSGPSITKAEGADGNNFLWVTFSAGVYTNAGQSGSLGVSDFTLTDIDNSRTINNVSHVAGDTGATLTLSSNLDGSNDIDVDTLAAAPSEIFDSSSNRMGTESVTVVGLVLPSITSITGSTGSDQLTVTFSENVYSNNNHTGPILVTDLNATGLTIDSVDHTAGAVKAYLTLSAALTGSEYGSASYTIAVASSEIFNYIGVSMDTTAYQITEDTTAFISSAEGVVGSDTIKVTFVEAAYANSNQTGDLQTSDLAITDSDNSRTITGITHTAGNTIAYLTLSSALDGTSDIDTDTVAAAGGAIFKADGSVMGTTPATITAQAVPTIASAQGQTGYNKIEVTFSEGVWTGTGQTGALAAGDFTIIDSDNSRTITGVTHTAGETVATLTLSSALDASADIDTDTVAAQSSQIFNSLSNAVSTGAVTVILMPVPTISLVEGYVGGTDLYVTFTEGVSTDPGGSPVSIGSLAANFVLSGAVNATVINSITHVGGDRFATFTMNGVFDAADIDNATLTPPGGSIFNQSGYPLGTESVTLTAQDTPVIAEVNGTAGYDLITVRLSQEVFANAGADPNDGLQPGDLTLVDGDGRTILSVEHIPGKPQHYQTLQDYAYVTLSAPLDADDINVPTTTIAANGIYNSSDNTVPTTSVQITSMPMTTIESVTGSVGSDQLEVIFKHWVASNPGMEDALVPGDFVLTDTNSDNDRTITAVEHRPGDITATLTMSALLIYADLNADTIAAAQVEIFNNYDIPADTSAVQITSRYGGPRIVRVIGLNAQQGVVVTFDQGVYANSDGTGALQPSDFTYYEVRQSTKTNAITSVNHNPGDDYAVLHFEFNRCNKSTYCVNPNDAQGDFYADQIGPAANSMFGKYGVPADLTSVTMIPGKRGFLAIAEGVTGSTKVLVKFSEKVWTNKDASGSLVAGDFCYTSNNSRTISSIAHNPGDDYAVLTMSGPTIDTDFNADEISVNKNQVWTGYDYGISWGGTTCPDTGAQRKFLSKVPAPIITGVQAVVGSSDLRVTFSEGVKGLTGNLQSTDFVFTDVSGNSNSIQSVSHIAGESVAYLTMNQAVVAGDLDTDTIAATANLKSLLQDNPLNTTAVALRGRTPALVAVEGSTGTTYVEVTFSSPVYANNNRTGNLVAADFNLVDVSGNGNKTITAVNHTAGDSTAVLTLSAYLDPEDIAISNPDTMAAVSSSIYDSLGQTLGTTAVVLTSYDGPWITRVEGTAGQDKVQVNFSEGVYSAPGQLDALDTSDFVLTDSDNGRTITVVEHYAGSAAALLTLSSALDRDADVGMDTVAAASNEIFNKSDDAARTTPVTMIGNECPPGGYKLDFNETAGSTTISDTTGLVVGKVFSGDPAFGILGDGYFTGDPLQQVATYIDFNQNTRCFKTPRAYTIETRVYYEDVDIDYGDVYPLNGIDDDYDYGGAVGKIPDSTAPDGKNVTNMTNFYRGQGLLFLNSSRNNWNTPGGGDGVIARKDKSGLHLRHRVKDRIFCDGEFPGDAWIGAASPQEEWGSNKDDYPFVSGHWYTLRVVFNTDKGYTSFDFFARDEGTDGSGTGANWTGYINITKEPSQNTLNCSWNTNPDSEFVEVDAPFSIGDDNIHDSSNDVPGALYTPWIMGKMDWLSFKPIADYSGVEGGPWRENTVPVADAGPDQNVAKGTRVTLDGTGSFDGDDDELIYLWTLVSIPAEANPQLTLNDRTVATPAFTTSKEGDYIIELVVNDGTTDSVVDSIKVTATP